MNDTHRITALEQRVTTLELLVNDVMHQLDTPDKQPKSKVKSKASGQKKKKDTPPKPKKKHTPPSIIVSALLKEKPYTQAEIESETGMDTKAVEKCLHWMQKNNIVKNSQNKTYTLTEQ